MEINYQKNFFFIFFEITFYHDLNMISLSNKKCYLVDFILNDIVFD